MTLPKPYYDHAGIYHGDCRDILPELGKFDLLLTDPPYPNNAGHFLDGITAAREVCALEWSEAIVCWSELEFPPVKIPPVAVHIWHRANVNGRPYEPWFHFAVDGVKRRSEILRHAAVFDGAGPGCQEFLGHPTQKPRALMYSLLKRARCPKRIVDPFCGVGATLHAAKDAGIACVGIEIIEKYCEVAANRLRQEVLFT